ncbi:hypothetical protein FRC06_000976 [Ceratobasidium sp. 370]|nr:hypothetical protein FRC06_000976 [Ceratobasidium sp. 370]
MDQQDDWRASNTRLRPASECQLLDEECVSRRDSGGCLVRMLAMIEARINDSPAPVPGHMVETQRFAGLAFVGIVGTLRGREGLFAQCGWFADDELDWFWVRIESVESMELWADPRFRGGTPCVWITTSIAEYALTIPHPTHDDDWEATLQIFGAPRCDEWPKYGTRPNWWPIENDRDWPYERPFHEQHRALIDEDELERLASKLSVQPTSSSGPWWRLGPKGDTRPAGQPLHNLSQISEWQIVPDSGLKATRDDAKTDDDPQGARAEGRGGKRRKRRRF